MFTMDTLYRFYFMLVKEGLSMAKFYRRMIQPLIFLLFSFLIVNNSKAYQFHEHRSMGVDAINSLGASHRVILDKLWAEARFGYESRLTESVVDSTIEFIDYATWPAIAGDHSCSSENAGLLKQ